MKPMPASARAAGAIGLLAAVYAAAGKAGLSLGNVGGFAAFVWPPTGISLAALLILGHRLWPGVLLGAFVTNVWAGASPAVALGVAIGNTLEAVLGAYVVRRVGDFRGSFESVRHVSALIFGAAALSTLVSATVGVASLTLGGLVHSTAQAAETWRAWWLGDALGNLIVAPVLLTLCTPHERIRWSGARVAEATSLVALLVLSSAAIFLGPPSRFHPFEFPYVLFPLFIWAALRFQLRGAAAAPALTSAIAVAGAERGLGPFMHDSLPSGLLAVQSFTGFAVITPLLLAGALEDRARAVRAQDSTMAAISHDLKNPLSAIVMSGEVLVRKVADPAARHHVETLHRTVNRMMRLIADIMAVSAIERGLLELQSRAEDARSMIDEALDLLRPLAVAKGVGFDASGVETVQVACDRDRILQVLTNVVGNAIKFCPRETTISLAVISEPAARRAKFSVRDRGPGIPPGERCRVFERYRHAKVAEGGGSGLGLFIAKGIVHAHGGRIWVESETGAGSTFHFTLPTANRGAPAREQMPLAAGQRAHTA
jgi:signal transduction histidine kinase